MASRYGRNKRRAHREEIARLTEALYGRWARSRTGVPEIGTNMVTEVVEERRIDRYGARKSAAIKLGGGIVSDVVREAIDGGRLNFDGFEWLLVSVDQTASHERGVEISMAVRGFTRG